ncbi:diphosphomevalonate decarboxylase [Xylanimonas sp. McL0601]|uniref:diphosphomevalonate decarboxylase n=1 Tax=Xylanimonas sp. McL0601 TaxID=3414739 RepID=UPI003CEBA8F2
MNAATAVAHPNIALVKYWGKQDEALNLPATGSLSLTLDVLPTVTTVTPGDGPGEDTFELNGRPVTGAPLDRVRRFLDLVRARAGVRDHAHVVSRNTVPTGAGLASSASGFAALATAASAAYGLPLDVPSLSRLARRGSGSAARSVVPGLAVWHAGDDATSFAEPVAGPALAMVLATVDAGPKPVPSREAMRRTAATSPYYPAWLATTHDCLEQAVAACARGDLPRLGRLAEANALRMHAAIQACDPPVRYLAPGSVRLFDRVALLRAEGVDVWATADAGPNVVAVCRPEDATRVAGALAQDAAVTIAGAGPGARLVGAPAIASGIAS